MENINKENFFNGIKDQYPLAHHLFLAWIDEWKKSVGFNYLVNPAFESRHISGHAETRLTADTPTKFHDLPFDMQYGVFVKFLTSCHYREFKLEMPFMRGLLTECFRVLEYKIQSGKLDKPKEYDWAFEAKMDILFQEFEKFLLEVSGCTIIQDIPLYCWVFLKQQDWRDLKADELPQLPFPHFNIDGQRTYLKHGGRYLILQQYGVNESIAWPSCFWFTTPGELVDIKNIGRELSDRKQFSIHYPYMHFFTL